ncbi:REP-associated tyrosine transposase [Thiohalophilus sp.]|uniref:REP-associated tyrosine transposase n=1 Tax=Thiohalophilus sp. TaxID=3028392 RepID=UPI002ACE6276|nr:transposase [Thiohalophilus sp.]MDZ7662774.1 transposase [Thiohalophilus sp.]
MDGKQKTPHSRNLRKGRYSSPFQVYLITAVTWNRMPVFADIWAGRRVVQIMRDYQRSAETLCYVVMPDHFHWLFRLLPGFSLVQVVGGVKRNSTCRVNRYLNRQARLWQDGFHDRALRRDEDMKAMARYIVANPLRAGLVSDIGDYPLWDAAWL